MKHDDPDSWTARPERNSVDLRGFALGEGLDADIKVSDVSYDGCQILSEASLTPGDNVELRIISRGRAFAEVRWVAGERAGVRFVTGS